MSTNNAGMQLNYEKGELVGVKTIPEHTHVITTILAVPGLRPAYRGCHICGESQVSIDAKRKADNEKAMFETMLTLMTPKEKAIMDFLMRFERLIHSDEMTNTEMAKAAIHLTTIIDN